VVRSYVNPSKQNNTNFRKIFYGSLEDYKTYLRDFVRQRKERRHGRYGAS
jgi:hypothetical protein